MLEFVVKHMATKDDIADVKFTLADHTKILNDHTRNLAIIKKDLTTNLDKRLQLEVRVSAIESTSASTRRSPPDQHHFRIMACIRARTLAPA
jgi:hypothetical protein